MCLNFSHFQVVVIIVVWAVSLLVVYMLFLVCLEPLISGRTGKSYQEHVDEDESHQMTTTQQQGGVLDRVGHQQDKWKRQVREQRRNIYDRHTMLN
jgi:flagellar biosynthesis/type III secretory pathway M-ring protein FliF/YscJ